MARLWTKQKQNRAYITLDKLHNFCYDNCNTLMGTSKRSIFRQRAAGRCKAVGEPAEIPPGVAFPNGDQ